MDKKAFKIVYKIKNIAFFAVLGCLSVVGLLWFLRPGTSEIEKRELTEFPEFTLVGLMDGSYARGIDTWYADTYPMREAFIAGNHKLRTLYGNQTTKLINQGKTADEIPLISRAEGLGPDGAYTADDGNAPASVSGLAAATAGQNADPAGGSGAGGTSGGQNSGGTSGTSGGQDTGGAGGTSGGQNAGGADGASGVQNSGGSDSISESQPSGEAAGDADGQMPAEKAGGAGSVSDGGNGPEGSEGVTGPGASAGSVETAEADDAAGKGGQTGTEEELPEETFADEVNGTEGEMAGPIYVAGNSAYGLYYFARSGADDFVEMVNHTYDVLGSQANVYTVIAPLDSGALLSQSLQSQFGASNQQDAIEYVFSLLRDGVHAVNPLPSLKQHNSEYIYFRTDHHWTALGAYYAYVEFAKEKGITPHSLDQFEQREYDGFTGSYYASSRSEALAATPDTVIGYVPMGTNRMTMLTTDGTEMQWWIVNDVSKYRSGAKYSCFAGSDQPYAYAQNPQITDGSACVVIKDSFGNAFVPFLIDHYEYVYWIDFRYYQGTLPDLVNEKGITDIIYMIDIDNMSTSSMIKKMRRLTP